MKFGMVDEVPAYGARRGSREPMRDARLLAMHRNGLTGAEIARVLGITRERVRQIVKRETGESVRKIRLRTCDICEATYPVGHASDSAHRASPEHRAAIAARRVAAFWSRVLEAGSGCWEWQGAHGAAGYGHSSLFPRHGGGYAHRVSYFLVNGPIPDGLTIDHLCRNRGCVNPAHLEAVTQRENILRSPIHVAAINARKTHCVHGHSLADAYRDKKGNRTCRPCVLGRARKRNAA